MSKSLITLLFLIVSLPILADPIEEPQTDEQPNTAVWKKQKKAYTLSWTQGDTLYRKHLCPKALKQRTDTVIQAWKGERVGMEGLLLTRDAMTEDVHLEAKCEKGWQRESGFVRYVLTDDYRYCGTHPTDWPAFLTPDIIDTDANVRPGQMETRPLWCSVEVPRDAKKGSHKVELKVVGTLSGKIYGTLRATINVSEHSLPAPHDYTFHLNFWQQPYAISRYYNVPRWSDEHLELLRPYMKRLARGGQKVVSAILFYEPWGVQSEDKFDPMIETTLSKDGTWAYDYTVFDKWVDFMAECGIDQQIDCYSMIPWDMSFRYMDEASGTYKSLTAKTSDEAYKALWTAFLKSFAQHLKAKGWFDKTNIAMDERSMEDVLNAYRIAQEAVPGIHLALAGNYHKELTSILQDYCIAYGQHFTPEELDARHKAGQYSTCYTCCTEPHPNIFTNSEPCEATYLPVYCLANDFDGYLRWAWINWGPDPLHDSRFRLFASGDTYCIYPDNRSSIRYERFIDGVQMFEKIVQLRKEYAAKGDQDKLDVLNAAVASFKDGNAEDKVEVSQRILELKSLLQ